MPGFTYKIKDRKWTCCDCGKTITVIEKGLEMVCKECGNGLFDLLEQKGNIREIHNIPTTIGTTNEEH